MRSLPLFHRIQGQPVVVLGNGDLADPKRRLVERAGGIVVDDLQQGIDKGARIAFIAHEDGARCEADAVRLRCAGMLVNVVDRPDLCDFTTPSVLDRDPVLVAVGSGGASATLSKQLRLRLETLLPASLGKLAGALAASREAIRARWPEMSTRRQALDDALGDGGALDPLRENSHEEVTRWLQGEADTCADEVHEFVLGGDDPEDLTLRQSRLLGSADAVIADPAIPRAILDRARADALRLAYPPSEPLPSGLVVILRRR